MQLFVCRSCPISYAQLWCVVQLSGIRLCGLVGTEQDSPPGPCSHPSDGNIVPEDCPRRKNLGRCAKTASDFILRAVGGNSNANCCRSVAMHSIVWQKGDLQVQGSFPCWRMWCVDASCPSGVSTRPVPVVCRRVLAPWCRSGHQTFFLTDRRHFPLRRAPRCNDRDI